ncbi:MAG: hypothetical protein XD73_0799 [Anaerolinea thermophila]|jgi:hypothetical protein|uniref:Metallo-beta-lactamase domain-containing protein n=1 Tax=Anaerolinea thermophila TaxID=167964 RepID=A0A101FXM5_9CHLR|nr:MAG: hypothetical protein XD73_0799 [Anaerolinea thermophila]
MEEIAENVFIEEGYPRVVLGVLKLEQGLLMVDSPFRPEDVPSWQSKLSQLGAGMERLMVLLDAHVDRTMTIRAMETNVLAHDNVIEIIRSRSTSSKNQDLEPGPDWMHTEFPAGYRCVKAQMTFTDEALLHWDENPILVTHKPGAHSAGAWLIDETRKIVFIGDSVLEAQPPFFALADIETWISELNWLQSDRFKNFKLISSRNGVIDLNSVNKMAELLTKTKELMNDLASEDSPLESIPELASQLLKKLDYDPQSHERYMNRLMWGLEQYYLRNFADQETESKGEEE